MLSSKWELPKQFWKLWLIALAWIVLTIAIFPRTYAEADDPAMVDFLQHGFLVSFMSVIASRFLSALYHLNHQIPWYAIYHWSLLSICLSASWQLILRSALSKPVRYSALSVLTIVFLAFTTRMTFTYTSVLLGGLAMVFMGRLLFNVIAEPAESNNLKANLLQSVLFGVLLTLGFLTRWEGLKTLVFFVPFISCSLGYGVYHRLKNHGLKKHENNTSFFQGVNTETFKKLSSQVLLILLCFIAPLLIAGFVEKNMPISKEEAIFDRFMYAHEDNIGFGISNLRQQAEFPNLLKKLGWSEADYEMYQHWLYIDEKTFSTQHMEAFSKLTKPMIQEVMMTTLTPANFFQSVWHTINQDWFKKRQLSFLVLSAVIAVTFTARNRWQRLAPWFLLFLLFAGSWVMSVFLRFPLRVAGPVYFVSALSILALPGIEIDWLDKSKIKWPASPKRWVLSILLAVLSIVPIGETVYQTIQIAKKQAGFKKDYAFLSQLVTANGYLLRESGLVGIKWFDPLSANIPFFPESSAGWAIFSPPYYQRLAQVGLHQASDILPWMINQPKAWALIESKRIPTVQQYIWQHYHQRVRIIEKSHLPTHPKVKIYQIQRLPE